MQETIASTIVLLSTMPAHIRAVHVVVQAHSYAAENHNQRTLTHTSITIPAHTHTVTVQLHSCAAENDRLIDHLTS